MMKKVSIFLLLVAIAGYSLGQYDPVALEVLDKMSEKYRDLGSFKAEFTYVLENKMEDIQEDFTGDIIVKGDKFKLDLGEQLIYNNGETIWTYLKDVNEVNIDYYLPQDGDMTPSSIFSAYKKGYKYMLLDDEKIGNNTYYVIDLVPDDPNKPFYKARLWIDKADYSLSQWKLFDKTGNTYLYDITSFDGSYKANDTEFEFDAGDYPGVVEIDLR